MNPKENALRIIKFNKPERVAKECPVHRIGYFGSNHEGFDGGGNHLPLGSNWTDIWGTKWFIEHAGVMGFPRGYPLANIAVDLKNYKWPDPDDERLCAQIYKQAEGWKKEEKFLSGAHPNTVWEKSYMLVGMENIMMAFYNEPNAARELLHGIMDFQLGISRHYLRLGVEMVGMGDDLGTQNNLLLSPKIIYDFLVPEYKRLFALYKKHNVIVNFHSCGHITPILDLFMELGVDILNPIQATANDLDEVREKTRGKMALQGGVKSATIVDGPIEKIYEEVRERITQLGKEGGYFCGPDQGMPWPQENFEAFEKAVAKFGKYPL